MLFLLVATAVIGWCAQASPVSAQTSAPEESERVSGNVPTQAEQDDMLAAMRQYAGQYISHLPNFICVQVTQQFEAGRRADRWRRGDTLRFKLIFVGGTEDRSVELVNDKPPSVRKPWRTPLSTEGEFGTLLGSVFGQASAAWFTWHGWDAINGHKVAVFDFTVDREHSTMKLSLSDLARVVVPYRGSVYADPLSGDIWQISNGPFDIPKEVRTKSLATTIQYHEVQISGTRYLLPVKATVLLDTGSNTIRNEIGFREYRKFETDSHVTFASESPSTDPNRQKPQK